MLGYLYTGEANEVRTEAKAGTLAGRDSDGGCERVEKSKRNEGRCADREDLTEVGLLGVEDEHGDERNYETLN